MVGIYDEDMTPALAQEFGVAIERFVEIAGRPWTLFPSASRYQSDPEVDSPGWYVAGHPIQVMIGFRGRSIVVATPKFHLDGPGALVIEPGEPSAEFDRVDMIWGEGLVPALRAAQERRRRTFFYCTTCRTSVGPENRFQDRTCTGCASRYHGIVF
jgi:hypothetical protein